jgi:nucleotide-binding universal stress UspA family protein
VYHLPTGYYKTGKTAEEFSVIMRDHALKKYNELLESVDMGNAHVVPIFIEDEVSHIPQRILETAQKRRSDLIIIGALGKSDMAALLLGSVTEKLMLKNADFPLLIVREKGKSINLLEAINKI